MTVRSKVEGVLLRYLCRDGRLVEPGAPLAEIRTVSGLRGSNKIFISYRHDDEPHCAGRIFERLRNDFGRWQVFLDRDALELGPDCVDQIDKALSAAEILSVVIGSRWLTPPIYEADDPHRREIRTALEQKKHIIPICVEGGIMPNPEDLPEELRPFTRRTGLFVTHDTWELAIERRRQTLAERLSWRELT